MYAIEEYVNSALGGSGKSGVFVNVYQTFCGNCRTEMPKWNEAMDQIKAMYTEQVTFLKIDAKKSKEIRDFYGIRSTPWIGFLGKGADNDGWNQYEGERTVEGYKSWMIE